MSNDSNATLFNSEGSSSVRAGNSGEFLPGASGAVMPGTVEEVARHIRAVLSPRWGKGEAEAMTRLIFHSLKGWSATDMVVNADRDVSDITTRRINEILVRLDAGEPIQYVTGEAYFYGMDLEVGPGVLIPRGETAELVDMIVDENDGADLRVLDVGTGSGCIAIALARNLKFAEVTAIDFSDPALYYARRNAAKTKARLKLEKADVFSYNPVPGSFDIIVSNPPYVAESEKATMEPHVLNYEPKEALFVSDADPLRYYRRIAEMGLTALKIGGKLYFEINPLFAKELASMLSSLGYQHVALHRDIHGKERFATCIR